MPIDDARAAMEADGGEPIEVRDGPVPDSLGEPTERGTVFEVEGSRFLLRVPNGLHVLVEDGTTITVDRPDHLTDDDVALWLLGSAWGALAYQRGHLPLHASAVVLPSGRVSGFCGPSGAGKSTLAAALAGRGRPVFADDVTTVIRPSRDGPPEAMVLAGHKTLKLWRDAAERLDAPVDRPVRTDEPLDKYYVVDDEPPRRDPAPLDRLYLLTDRDDPLGSAPGGLVERRVGMDAVTVLLGSIYRPMFGEHIVGRRRLFEMLAAVVARVAVFSFERPRRVEVFEAGVDLIARHLGEHVASGTEAKAVRR